MFRRRPAPETVAAVDLGSNSFHMIVARLQGDHLHVLDRLRDPVRLAAGLDPDHCIKPAAYGEAIACLRRFGQRVSGMPPGSVRAVGTNTLRVAANAREFLGEAAEALGHPVEVIGGHEEARLIYLGVAHNHAMSAGRRLVVDIGGGSTELIVGERFEPVLMESLHMGCVDMTARHFPKGACTPDAWRAAELAARLELQPVEGKFRRLGWAVAVGASGTLLAVEQAVRGRGWTSGGIGPAALQRLKAAMIKAGHADRFDFPGLNPKRAEVFAGGVAVLCAVFDALGIEHMDVSDGALREGVIHDLLGRIRHEDVRGHTVAGFMERFHVDGVHAGQVERQAIGMLESLGESCAFDDADADLLRWAARLHEVGLVISHNQHHKHGAWLVENADLPGFSHHEQKALAMLVRAHRRKFPVALFEGIPAADHERLLRLAVLLRFAVLLQRGRVGGLAPLDGLALDGRRMVLRFGPGWLDAHPLTRADLEQERGWLMTTGVELRFE